MKWVPRRFRRREMDEQLDKELRFHLDQHAADLMADGHGPEQARRAARLALGGPQQVKEACRDVHGARWLDDLWHDVRYALRTLGHRPGFAAVLLGTLALGIGATTVMFTVING
ncbi:MAG: ABC transporter permease, partial [Acidobacteria bacterium]